jgi:hypothetical protein
MIPRSVRLEPPLILFFLVSLTVWTAGCGASEPAPLKVTTAVFPNIPEPRAAPADARTLWAAYYGGEAAPVALTPEEGDLWRAIEKRTGRTCRLDGKLVRGARLHAADLLESRAAGVDGRLDRLRFTLHTLGAYDYAIEPITGTLERTGRGTLVDAVERGPSDWTHCGLGIASNGTDALAVWIGVRRLVRLSPLPVVSNAPADIPVFGELLGQLTAEVKLFIGRPNGSACEATPREDTAPGRFAFDVSLVERGRYELELLVDTGHGLETVALVPLFIGVATDDRPTMSPSVEDPADAPPEETLCHYLDGARRKAGLAPLIRDGRLDRIARRHSEDMASSGFFGHVSPTKGSLRQRLKRQRLSPKRFAENIAKSSTLLRIHQNLMRSPSHREVMISPEFTHIGVGVARQQDELIATEIYVAW